MFLLQFQSAAFAVTLWDRLVGWYHRSVFRELIDYLDTTYFSVDLGIYQHFSVSSQTGSVVKNLILGLAFGFILAAGISCYLKTVHGGFVRRLLAEGCNSPETARSLYELGYFHNISIRNQLRRGGTIGALVRRVGAAGEPATDATDLSAARFYIPEDLRYRAEFRYEKKGSGAPVLILTVVLTVVAAALLCHFLPQLLGLADVILGIFR